MTPDANQSKKKFIAPLVIWGAIFIAALYFAPKLNEELKAGNMLAPGTESDEVRLLVGKELDGSSDQSLIVVLSAKHLLVENSDKTEDSDYKKALEPLLQQIHHVKGVDGVTTYWDTHDKRFIGKDGKTTFLLLSTKEPANEIQAQLIPDLKVVLARGVQDFTIHLTGEQAIGHDLYYESIEAVSSSDLVAIPIILLVLLIIFRSVIASLVPLGLGMISILVTLAVYYFYAKFFHGDTMAPAVISMLGLGIGIDYSLFIVTRFREELALGLNGQQAAARTSATAGKAVFFSGITVMVSVASLLIVDNPMFRSLAASMIFVVLVSLLVATTLLPTVLGLLGTKVNSWRLPWLGRASTKEKGTFWHRWALAVMRKPILFSLLSLIPLLCFAYPVKYLKTGWPNVNLLSPGSDARQGYELMAKQFGEGELQSIDVIIQVTHGAVAGEQNLDRIHAISAQIRKDPSVSSLLSFVDLKDDLDLPAYKKMYLEDPVQLVNMPAQLGKVGAGLNESVAGLQKIRAGLQEMQDKIKKKNAQTPKNLAAIAKQFKHSSEELASVAALLKKSNFEQADSAAKKTAEGSRLLDAAAQGMQKISDQNLGKDIGALLNGLKEMAAGLDQIIPGLQTLASRLSEVGDKSGHVDLSTIVQRGDFGLRAVAAGGGKQVEHLLRMLVNINGAADIARIRVVPKQGADTEDTKALIQRLRAMGHHVNSDFATIKVGGLAAAMLDYDAQIRWALPRVIGLVMVITFFVMLLLLKSIILPIKAIIMNSLSVLSAYGVMVLVFQDGYLSDFLGFVALGYVGSPTIVMLFAILFGLSMDYEVFLLSRIKEAHDRSGRNEEAVALGLEQTAGIITGAASIMLVVFGTFLVNGIITVKEFGIGLFTAVLLDATLIRIILVPAFMRLFGEWNWWAPKWLMKFLNKIHVE